MAIGRWLSGIESAWRSSMNAMILACLILLTGCADSEPATTTTKQTAATAPSPQPSTDPARATNNANGTATGADGTMANEGAMKQYERVLTMNDAGKTIQVTPDTKLLVRLPAQLGTGSLWRVDPNSKLSSVQPSGVAEYKDGESLPSGWQTAELSFQAH